MRVRLKNAVAAALLASFVAGCSGIATVAPQPVVTSTPSMPLGAYIKHVVIIVQENRSFDNMFAGWPGADAPTYGFDHAGKKIPLHAMKFADDQDTCHLFTTALQSYADKKMNGFDLNVFGTDCSGAPVGTYVYSYLAHSEIPSYRAMASRYVLADHMFPTELGTSFTSHQDLVSGTTRINATHSLVDTPSGFPWGCDASPGTTTRLVDEQRKTMPGGPFPCFTQYPTMANLLDAGHVSWKYYVPTLASAGGAIWNAYDAIKHVRYGADWTRNVISPDTIVLGDPAKGALPSVSWVVPDLNYSDHPASPIDAGPSWVADVVNAIGESKYWKDTAIVVLWDDWGGWYDNVPPPQLDYVGLGIRVPCLIVSPYARKSTVVHTQYEFGSVLKFVEQVYGLPSLNSSDARANSLIDAFDFTQTPLTFQKLPAKYPPSYFISNPESKELRDGD